MDRLTDKRFVGEGFYQRKSREERLEILSHKLHLKDIYNRLAEYEDTGLTPEEIRNMKAHCENTGDIIKTLANNGYNTITINCYKDIESKD